MISYRKGPRAALWLYNYASITFEDFVCFTKELHRAIFQSVLSLNGYLMANKFLHIENVSYVAADLASLTKVNLYSLYPSVVPR